MGGGRPRQCLWRLVDLHPVFHFLKIKSRRACKRDVLLLTYTNCISTVYFDIREQELQSDRDALLELGSFCCVRLTANYDLVRDMGYGVLIYGIIIGRGNGKYQHIKCYPIPTARIFTLTLI